MKFSIFKSPRAKSGELCTYDRYLEISNSPQVIELCNQIAREEDKQNRSALKSQLPVITWQAYFPEQRLNVLAQPSGLFMLDIDHVENPYKLYEEKICGNIGRETIKDHFGIMMVQQTASQHGLRIVAKCYKDCTTLAECQRKLAEGLDVPFDSVCKDFARCSFVVVDSYTFFMNSKLFTEEPEDGTIYNIEDANHAPAIQMEIPHEEPTKTEEVSSGIGEIANYKGIPYDKICLEWLKTTGGEPVEGERNTRLYRLALRLRYLTDFDFSTMYRVLPRYGLPDSEIKALVLQALKSGRASNIPLDMQRVLSMLQHDEDLEKMVDEEVLPEIITDTTKMPSLPPLIREWYQIAPEDFKSAVVLCQLPILGTLGSRLRAQYLDGKMQTPSFQVSLEAPQASGKSFITRLAEYELAEIIRHDDEQREKERDYQKKASELKMLNIKVKPENKDEILGTKPESIIRYVPATMSITKLLMRMEAAKGLHLFAIAPEVDTVYKAFKRGFSSFSDALRQAFDNERYGQDYASDNSFSGSVNLYYNCLFSGTPKAMRRFYPDIEDGLVSRVTFVTLPDQFGKPMPVWKEFNAHQKAVVDMQLVRLGEVSLIGDEIQPEHVLKMDFVNVALRNWILQQQMEAKQTDDRTRDIFCRRAAVVGFRAAMLAFFLWGGHPTPQIRKNVTDFAIWVANNMLNQHLLRFNIEKTSSNTLTLEDVYHAMEDEFGRQELQEQLNAMNYSTPVKTVLYKWRLAGVINEIGLGVSSSGKKMGTRFRKTIGDEMVKNTKRNKRK